ncbi:response regulator [Methylobacterium sp. J-070]|uniref:response regulator n=1 Tax=Methylobacterium sp. J-070 TaxID=2836650 RepID=UPI0028C3AB38|nr:response regulator [Methylobacterium sp. J-070]
MSDQLTSDPPCALVVDDDTLILMDAIQILEDAGFRVFEAMNVADALAMLDQHHRDIQLLFTDVHMPGDLDGFALARRTAERFPHVAIVVASGEAKPGPDDLPEGATFIAKPFSAEVVHHHVRKTMPAEKHPPQLRRTSPSHPD